MRMTLRSLAGVLSVPLALAACSQRDAHSKRATGGSSLDAATTAERPAEARPSASGIRQNEIAFGMVASFSGSNKDRGRAMRAGWLTAFAAANDAGGVNGRALRLVARDDGYDPKRTVPMMQELVDKEKVFAIVELEES